MSGTVAPALSQGVGYGIVLGLGLAFALFMVSCHHHDTYLGASFGSLLNLTPISSLSTS